MPQRTVFRVADLSVESHTSGKSTAGRSGWRLPCPRHPLISRVHCQDPFYRRALSSALPRGLP